MSQGSRSGPKGEKWTPKIRTAEGSLGNIRTAWIDERQCRQEYGEQRPASVGSTSVAIQARRGIDLTRREYCEGRMDCDEEDNGVWFNKLSR